MNTDEELMYKISGSRICHIDLDCYRLDRTEKNPNPVRKSIVESDDWPFKKCQYCTGTVEKNGGGKPTVNSNKTDKSEGTS